ncbi:MAG: DUF488 family protein [Candidatus Binatia bacterium]
MPQQHRLKLPSASTRKQVEHKALWNEARAAGAADFFTIGYTGRKLDELIECMLAAGVCSLIDIRQNPVSMYRPELSKANLRRRIEEYGISYLHLPELGVPRDIRAKAIDAGNREPIWDWYDEHVVRPYVGRNLHRFLNGADHPVAFMCVELDPRECHRHRLFLALEEWGLRGFDL